MVHCVHKFNLFKCRLWFIANAKHFTYAACWIFQKFKFSINHCRLQQQATFLQLDCESKSWESSKSVVLATFWRPMTLHLCRLQQQATFHSSIAMIWWTFLKNRTFIDFFKCSSDCNQLNKEIKCLKHLYFHLLWSCTALKLYIVECSSKQAFQARLRTKIVGIIQNLDLMTLLTLYLMNFSQESYIHRLFSTLCCLQSV